MILLIGFAFLAGFITILSPCILPILPILLSGGATGGRRRPIGIIAGFICSFTFFTLTLSAIVQKAAIPADSLRGVAVFLLGVFGMLLAVPALKDIFERWGRRVMPAQFPRNSSGADGFWGGSLIGISLGLVWTPCVGPILASVITLAAANSVGIESVLIVLAYSLGTGIPMLTIMLGGRRSLERVSFLKRHSISIQRIFGYFIVIMAIALTVGLDRKFEGWILNKFPGYGMGLISLEDRPEISRQLERLNKQ